MCRPSKETREKRAAKGGEPETKGGSVTAKKRKLFRQNGEKNGYPVHWDD